VKEIRMKKIKYFLWFVIIVLLGIFIYQNNAYFTAENSVAINLGFYEGESAELPNIVYFAIVFAVGFLLALILNFSKNYQKRKTIKELNEKINSDKKRIDELEARLSPVETSAYGNVDTTVGDVGGKPVDVEPSEYK
jgi:uncharacterized integral membrane protein